MADTHALGACAVRHRGSSPLCGTTDVIIPFVTKSTKSYNLDASGTVTFELAVSKETILSAYQKTIRQVSASLELPGFRKGKAPLDLAEKNLDKSKLYAKVLEQVIPPSYLDYIKSNQLTPISEPRITPIAMEEGKDWQFKVELAVMPDFELGEYEKYVKDALTQHDKIHKHDSESDDKHKHNHKLEVIFDALLSHTQFAVSPVLIEAESKAALSRLVKELNSLNLTVTDYAKSQKLKEAELVKEYEKNAALRLRLELILQKLGKSLSPKAKNRQEVLDFLVKL